jgi:acyl-coenzyme A thioesterase PaaI-like protein
MEIPKLNLEKVENNQMCMGCGKANTHGFKLEFRQDGKTALAYFTPSPYHQGWPGFAHGGALMTVMDEAIGWACHFAGIFTVTAKIEIRIKSMASIGEPLIVSATIAKQTRRTLELEADIKRPDGSVVAEASSIQFITQTPG